MLLQVNTVSKSFVRGNKSFFAVKDVDFSIDDGGYANIIGRSGSGKTTLLNMISGILTPDSGTILFNGSDIAKYHDAEKSLYRNESIGFVPQTIGSLPNLSVMDNVRIPHFLFARDGDGKGRAMILLEMMGIAHLCNELPSNLSGGETKRMLIARALMNAPKLLIADEPTADLDTATTQEVMAVIKNINAQGTAIVIVTHDTEIIPAGTSVYVMSDGCLTAQKNGQISG